jgi:hypothetical protein
MLDGARRCNFNIFGVCRRVVILLALIFMVLVHAITMLIVSVWWYTLGVMGWGVLLVPVILGISYLYNQ